MVAYSFHPRFVGPILTGLGSRHQGSWPKRQTIRAPRKNGHARPGEELQLYTGLRTKGATLLGKARCTSVEPIKVWVQAGGGIEVTISDEPLDRWRVASLALDDGFGSIEDMTRFFREMHGVGLFEGVLIKWEPLP